MTDHYLVFAGRKWQNAIGKQGITWDVAGLFAAESPEQACLVVAQKQGVGTCFAIAGYAWGVDLVDAGQVNEIGVQLDPVERLERMGAKLGERLSQILPSAPRPAELDRGDDDADR